MKKAEDSSPDGLKRAFPKAKFVKRWYMSNSNSGLSRGLVSGNQQDKVIISSFNGERGDGFPMSGEGPVEKEGKSCPIQSNSKIEGFKETATERFGFRGRIFVSDSFHSIFNFKFLGRGENLQFAPVSSPLRVQISQNVHRICVEKESNQSGFLTLVSFLRGEEREERFYYNNNLIERLK